VPSVPAQGYGRWFSLAATLFGHLHGLLRPSLAVGKDRFAGGKGLIG